MIQNTIYSNTMRLLLVLSFSLLFIWVVPLKAQEITPASGFFTNSARVEVHEIPHNYLAYYTTDGKIPNSRSTAYNGPFDIKKSTSVRFVFISPVKNDTIYAYRTYFINETTDLAVVSLTTDPDNFYSNETGIYVAGTNGIPGNCSDAPRNWNQDWERPIHVEYFEKNRELGFAMDGGVKIGGGCSRSYPQKQLHLYFSNSRSGKLKYQVFEDKPITTFKRLILRNGGNDWSQAMMRNELALAITKNMDLGYQAFKPVSVFLNGDYLGLHMLMEKKNEDFLESNYGFNADEIDILKSKNTIVEGSSGHYDALLEFIETHDLSVAENYEWVSTQMEIEQYIDYQIAEIFMANSDWPMNNIRFWRPQTPDSKWKWLIFDLDFSMGSGDFSKFTSNNLMIASGYSPNQSGEYVYNPQWYNFLLRNLLKNEDFRNLFIQRYNVHLQTNFESAKTTAVLDSMAALIANEIPRHVRRWGGSTQQYGRNWNYYINDINNFLTKRGGQARRHLEDKFGIKGRNKLQFSINPAGSGRVLVENQAVDPDEGIFLYNYIPANIMAEAAPGYVFSGWGTEVDGSGEAAKITLDAENITVTAHFKLNKAAGREIVINEVNYKSADSHNTGDWIEFYNNTSQNIDISGWYFSDEKDSHAFYFPINTILQSNGFIVLSEDIDAFNSFHPDVENVVGNMDFGLSKSGELIRLINNNGEIVDSLTYKSEAPWPTEPNGLGATMALVHPNLDGSDGNNWAASFNFGTPGRANTDVMVSNEEDFISDLPQSLELEQNYPNPFNPSTIIGYVLSQPTEVKLSIYSVTGAKVTELVNQRQNAGRYQVIWNAALNNMSSGIYFYRLEAQGETITKKLLLLK